MHSNGNMAISVRSTTYSEFHNERVDDTAWLSDDQARVDGVRPPHQRADRDVIQLLFGFKLAWLSEHAGSIEEEVGSG